MKVRSKVHFYKPTTMKLERAPKYPRKSMPSMPLMDKHRVIKYPLTTEVGVGVEAGCGDVVCRLRRWWVGCIGCGRAKWKEEAECELAGYPYTAVPS